MAQVTFFCEATVTTSWMYQAATTSGPFHLPAWAPDIAYMPTTTNLAYAIMMATTSVIFGENGYKTHAQTYTARSFSIPRIGDHFNRGAEIRVTYRAVGELVVA